MAWQDRSYYRESGSGASNPLMWLLTGSVPLFTAFGIRVRMHAMMVVMIVLTVLTAGTSNGMGVKNALTFSAVLFGVVLLHEFGHCFAARSVGGSAKDILLWPLGGLAFADAPNRPWPQLVTTAGGPLVNVLICIVAAVVMAVVRWGEPSVPWNPLSAKFYIPYDSIVAYVCWFVFVVSWGNLLFNLLPIYPMDGGRLLQELLWFKLGYYRSMIIALTVGIVGGALMALDGLINFGSWYGGVLFFIGVSCLWTCYATRAAMRAEGPWGFQDEDSVDYSASLFNAPAEKGKHKRLNKRLLKRAQQREAAELAEQERVDAILAKVSAHGMQSLTWWERRALHKATERQRKRDVGLKEEMTRKGF